jgi:DNA-directed RNA polymerase specialized sigma24 family protein
MKRNAREISFPPDVLKGIGENRQRQGDARNDTAIASAWSSLTDEQRWILTVRCLEGKTRKDVAAYCNTTIGRIDEMERNAKRHLRREMEGA